MIWTDNLISKLSRLVKLCFVLLILLILLLPYCHGNQSCVTASDIMSEVNASSPDQSQEVGAVLGRVLYHALRGRCFTSRSLPEESFFLDYILSRLGSENFTVGGKCTSETQKKTGTQVHIKIGLQGDSSLKNPEPLKCWSFRVLAVICVLCIERLMLILFQVKLGKVSCVINSRSWKASWVLELFCSSVDCFWFL